MRLSSSSFKKKKFETPCNIDQNEMSQIMELKSDDSPIKNVTHSDQFKKMPQILEEKRKLVFSYSEKTITRLKTEEKEIVKTDRSHTYSNKLPTEILKEIKIKKKYIIESDIKFIEKNTKYEDTIC